VKRPLVSLCALLCVLCASVVRLSATASEAEFGCLLAGHAGSVPHRRRHVRRRQRAIVAAARPSSRSTRSPGHRPPAPADQCAVALRPVLAAGLGVDLRRPADSPAHDPQRRIQ